MKSFEAEGGRVYRAEKNPAQKIGGFFYYTSAAFLWIGGLFIVGYLIISLFSFGIGTIAVVFVALLYGFPGWIWAAMGVVLFFGHRSRYRSRLSQNLTWQLWIGTLIFNLTQGWVLFKIFEHPALLAIGVWNFAMVALSVAAMSFEHRQSKGLK